MNSRAYKTGGLDCPKCQAMILAATPVNAGSQPRGFKKGHITVCAYCHAILELGDSAYREMTKRQLKKLDPESKRTLNLIINRLRKRPHEDN